MLRAPVSSFGAVRGAGTRWRQVAGSGSRPGGPVAKFRDAPTDSRLTSGETGQPTPVREMEPMLCTSRVPQFGGRGDFSVCGCL